MTFRQIGEQRHAADFSYRAGSSPMVAGLTYYGSLAHGATSQFAGCEDFNQ